MVINANQGAELATRTQSLNLNSSARYAKLCNYAITASQFALGQSRKLATVAEDEGYVRRTADLKTPTQIGENFYGPRTLYSALQDSGG